MLFVSPMEPLIDWLCGIRCRDVPRGCHGPVTENFPSGAGRCGVALLCIRPRLLQARRELISERRKRWKAITNAGDDHDPGGTNDGRGPLGGSSNWGIWVRT